MGFNMSDLFIHPELHNLSMLPFTCAHVASNEFLSLILSQGAHVTINARSEMDLEEDTVMDKVSKASGENKRLANF